MEEILDCEELCCVCDITLKNSDEYSNHLETDAHLTMLVENRFLSEKIANLVKHLMKLYGDSDCGCSVKMTDFESYANHLKCPAKYKGISDVNDVSTMTDDISSNDTSSNGSLPCNQSSLEQSTEIACENRHSKNYELAHSKKVPTNGVKDLSKLRRTKHYQKHLMKQYYNNKANKVNGSDAEVDNSSRAPIENGRRPQSVKVICQWSQADLDLLASSVRKFNSNWKLINLLCFPQKTPQEIQAAWASHPKRKKQHDSSSRKSKKGCVSDGEVSSIKTEQSENLNKCVFHSSASASTSRTHEPQILAIGSQDSDCEFLEDEECLPLSLIKKRVVTAQPQKSSSTASKSSSNQEDESLTLSVIKKQFEAAKQSRANTELKTCQDVFSQNEDVPLAKLKMVQSFDSYLKELPLEVRNKICNTLTVCGDCRAHRQREMRPFRLAMIKLLPVINVLQSSLIYTKYSDIEIQLAAQLSTESKNQFRAMLISVRNQMGSRLNYQLRNFSEVLEREKKTLSEAPGSDHEAVLETISNGNYSPTKSINTMKKLSLIRTFRNALRSLLSEYLDIFYVACISPPREEVLKVFIGDILIPVWNSAIYGKKAKLRGGVTVDLLLELSREVLDSTVTSNKTGKKQMSGIHPTKKMKLTDNTAKDCSSGAVIKANELSSSSKEPIYIDANDQDARESTIVEHSTVGKSEIPDCLNEDLDTPLANLMKPPRK